MRIKPVAAVFVVLALAVVARNSVAGELDDLLLDREPPRMTPSMAYSPVPPTDCPFTPSYCRTDRETCKQITCFGPDDVVCSLMGCSGCVYDVATYKGKCSGGGS